MRRVSRYAVDRAVKDQIGMAMDTTPDRTTTSANETLRHLERMLNIYRKRLYILEKQAALFGPMSVPPQTLIEIEDLR